MQWTNNQPEEEGWYWVQVLPYGPKIAKIYRKEGVLYVEDIRGQMRGYEDWSVEEYCNWDYPVAWAGPIILPEWT